MLKCGIFDFGWNDCGENTIASLAHRETAQRALAGECTLPLVFRGHENTTEIHVR